jgi:isopenicillin N synthase-like dioxygenase
VGPRTVDLLSSADLPALLGEALRDDGYALLKGHPILPSVIESAYDAGLHLHQLDDAAKHRLAVANGEPARGWHRGFESGRGSYETFEIGVEMPYGASGDTTGILHGPNRWPPTPGFRRRIEKYFDAVRALAMGLLAPLDVALGLPAGYLRSRASDPYCLLRVLQYDARQPGESKLGIAPHTDFELFTILSVTESGLEVCSRDGRWRSVELHGREQLLLLAGDMLELITGGDVESPLHRVLVGTAKRQALAFFFAPGVGCTIAPQRAVPAEKQSLYAETTVGQHLAEMQILSYPHLRARYEDGAVDGQLQLRSQNPYKLYKIERLQRMEHGAQASR